MELDTTDWNIINILKEGYENNNTIARALGLSEGTIRSRIKRLREAGVMQIRALINPEVLDNKQLALVAMRVAESRLLETKAEEVSRLPNVLSVSIASGRYDLIAEVLVDSNRGLVRFLTEELSGVEGVVSSESFLMLKSYNKFV
ncbi:Lrp/AsnC family transcriptional regulator [Gracilinema caldarium]|uniref:Lrp/AsnC family transcriptional regulator n=1 Tax=Gracilinema caldarium TaxID=215591 RepID=UPI0026F1CCA5|nr:Lrp/AsnC family transcriptional regulator [Gracilinema caldarium]